MFIAGIFTSCAMKQEESSSLPYYNGPDFTPIWLIEGDNVPDSIHKVDNFSFIDQNGETITSETYSGRIYALISSLYHVQVSVRL